jgi:hypothetical protein
MKRNVLLVSQNVVVFEERTQLGDVFGDEFVVLVEDIAV